MADGQPPACVEPARSTIPPQYIVNVPHSKWMDGALADLFDSPVHDWGVAGKPKFDRKQLTEMKKECELHCFSTLNHIVSYVYNNGRVIRWILRQAKNGFTTANGTVE